MKTDTIVFDSFDCVAQCDEVIDVRSPSEFAEDHIPGAINLPVLDDAERAVIGTLHRQEGEFEARRQGASLISANIAQHLKEHFGDKARNYRPMVYCWRGGQRSRSFATVLEAIGWRTTLVKGGYKSFRLFIRGELEQACAKLQPIILAGLTGSGKTKILRQMMESSSLQALDLEGLANHRGSLLGDEVNINNARQPGQKRFETVIVHAMEALDLARPVFFESESKRIGSVSVPECLWRKMIAAPVVTVEMPILERARFLVSEYDHFVGDPGQLLAKLPVLKRMHGASVVAEWESLTKQGKWLVLAESLLERHYDPSYRLCKNYAYPTLQLAISKPAEENFACAIDRITEFFSSES